MNPLDRLISFFSPGWALERAAARLALRNFDASKEDRQRARRVKAMGPRSETLKAREIVKMARDLDRNNGWAHGVYNAIVNNIVGKGIRLEPKVEYRDGRLNRPANEQISAAWNEWTEAIGFYETQRIVERELWVAGEVLVVRRRNSDLAVPIELDVVESERLTDNTEELSSGNQVLQGIEYTPAGKILAYHIWDSNPADILPIGATTGPQLQRIGADRVLHLFHRIKPGQIRGIPPIAAVARNFEGLGQYLDYELTRARIAAAFAIMIKRQGRAVRFPLTGDPTDQTDDRDNDIANLEGGMIFRGGPNDSIEGTGPAIQGTSFDPFVTLMLRAVASGLNCSYEILARDFTRTNFSSARQSALEDRRHWEPRQELLNEKLNTPAFRWFADAAAGVNIAPFPNFVNRRIPIEWRLPGWQWVDPQKELAADVDAVRAGFASPQSIAARRGADFEKNVREIAEARQLAESEGVSLSVFEPEAAATSAFPSEEEISAEEAEHFRLKRKSQQKRQPDGDGTIQAHCDDRSRVYR